MDTLSYKTLSSNKISADKKWFVVDAEGQNLGRFSSKIAKVLRDELVSMGNSNLLLPLTYTGDTTFQGFCKLQNVPHIVHIVNATTIDFKPPFPSLFRNAPDLLESASAAAESFLSSIAAQSHVPLSLTSPITVELEPADGMCSRPRPRGS